MELTKEQRRIAGRISYLAAVLLGASPEDDGFCEVTRTPKGNITIKAYSPLGVIHIKINKPKE